VVFIGQLVGKWSEGGWMALISFSVLALVAHAVLLSPAGYRHARQVNRIVHEKARVEGGMASIVKWQAFKMQEYRFRLMIAFGSFLELFGLRQLAQQPIAGAATGGFSMHVSRFYSTITRAASSHPVNPERPSAEAAQPAKAVQPETRNTPAASRSEPYPLVGNIVRHRVILPVDHITQGTLTALRYARSLASDVTAVHVSMDKAETEQLQKDWPAWGDGVRLVVLDSPHNMVLEPLLQYIQSLMALRRPNEVITVVVPQYVHPRWWSNLARTQMAVLLRLALPFQTGIVITDVPYALEGDGD
jgi:hypothetical protein